jgi:hypothetical protein
VCHFGMQDFNLLKFIDNLVIPYRSSCGMLYAL